MTSAATGANADASTTGDGGARRPPRPSRLDRRKARTRQALINAARAFLAEHGTAEVSIQQITDAADVGFGSFYNHFSGKDELFSAAIADVLEEHGRLMDERTAGLDDPAEVFAASWRLTARLVHTHPQMARILARTGLSYLDSDHGIARRALRDIRRATEAGRFHVDKPYVALAAAGGSLLGLLHLWLEHPGLIDDAACDELAEQVLRMFGMSREAAHAIAHRPLPALTTDD
ncbi:TetR family transcriptional regulator [Actinomadura sp. NBRC 104425]|uniref:TetR/AcrR family transcriptional regulator n=1 Tax=Actinomadura sp. NBRC 104425 TaxID=3032204 RepID=UPI0024A5B232|nr:TetR/AcrR family transcriptional regulator [Actinomadura sp. NBRC 104425]GLZ09793.1 TetR family transcriptional regulator [Actinomadura sp. NBRC 104425]